MSHPNNWQNKVWNQTQTAHEATEAWALEPLTRTGPAKALGGALKMCLQGGLTDCPGLPGTQVFIQMQGFVLKLGLSWQTGMGGYLIYHKGSCVCKKTEKSDTMITMV